jgi:hypothetical protein
MCVGRRVVCVGGLCGIGIPTPTIVQGSFRPLSHPAREARESDEDDSQHVARGLRGQPSPYNRIEKHRPMNFEGVCTFPTFFRTCLRVGSKLSLGTSRTRVSVTQTKMFAHQAYSCPRHRGCSWRGWALREALCASLLGAGENPKPAGRALAVYPARAATPTAADGSIDLFAVVVYGTEEYPAPKTEEVVALLLVLLVLIYTDGAFPLRQTLLVRRPLRYLWAKSRGV